MRSAIAAVAGGIVFVAARRFFDLDFISFYTGAIVAFLIVVWMVLEADDHA